MPLKGYRERIKQAGSQAEVDALVHEVRMNCPDRYLKRCVRVVTNGNIRYLTEHKIQKKEGRKHGKR